MRPATAPPPRRDAVRLLALDAGGGQLYDLCVGDLARILAAGDLLVVNDAATLPAALAGRDPRGGAVEARLVGPTGPARWRAVLLGAGDWRLPTEQRPPPDATAGDLLRFGDLTARVAAVSPRSPRLVELAFDRAGAALWSAIYAQGKPVQYAYLREELPLWSVQTAYGARPWAAEMPSAGRPLTWALLLALRRAGVGVARLTHAAGLSASGDPALDAVLPLPERYYIPAETAAAVATTRAAGRRVIAVGTTVVRALEGSAAAHGAVRAGEDVTDLVIDAAFQPRIVDGLLTGMHDPTESHFHLLRAFAPEGMLFGAWRQAARLGYRRHELGDVSLIAPDLPRLAEPISWTSSSVTDSRARLTGASTRRCVSPVSR